MGERVGLGASPCIGSPFASLGLSFPKRWPTLERMKDVFRSEYLQRVKEAHVRALEGLEEGRTFPYPCFGD